MKDSSSPQKYFKRIDYKLWFVISIQTLGAILGLAKLDELSEVIFELSALNLAFAISFILLCIIGLYSSWLLYQGKKLGYFLAKANFLLQIPVIESHKVLFEYYTLLRLKIFYGSSEYGFDFLTGTVFRIGINNGFDYWAIGMNLIPFVILYLLFVLEEQRPETNYELAKEV